MNNQNVKENIKHLLLLISEEVDDYPDNAQYRAIMDAKKRLEASIETNN